MIIVGLGGRLGNQMFQYAAGRALAYRLGIPLGLSSYFGRKSKYPNLLLNHFNIQTNIVPNKLNPPRNKFTWNLCKYGLMKPKIFRQRHGLGFDPNIYKVTKNTYMIGWWHSEKYFHDCKDVIKRDFEFISPIKNQNLEYYQEIIDTPSSISLHIRRGDYLDKENLANIGICSQGYYENAVLWIANNCSPPPTVFVFTDDPWWVSKNLNLPYKIRLIQNNTPEFAVEDLRLMTICKHHVIANSTFSWWGAWLGKNEKKIIIAPSPWYTNTLQSNPDIWCQDWIRVQNHFELLS